MVNKEDNEKKDKKAKGNKTFRGIIYLTNLGITIVATILISIFLGKFLDDLFGTSPWLVLVFSLLGAAAAIKLLFDMAND